jgi:bifunctional oligoribonuclease and PAP phosphatase NrnA
MNLDKFSALINDSNKILIVQADNPDGDSVSSSLALEALLSDLGKDVSMYCAVNIPSYLQHIPGWDRITQELPNVFELVIIVDTSAIALLETLVKSGNIKALMTKPCIIIDHHATDPTIDFSDVIINQPFSSTGEVIFGIASQLGWTLSNDTAEYIATSILFDTLGLTSESVSSSTLLTMSKLLEKNVSLAQLEERRRLSNKKSLAIVKLKAKLLDRIDTSFDSRIATVDITWPEIEKYSHEYNPSVLVLDEMRMIDGVMIAIAFKSYPDGKVTAKIRCNLGVKIAGKLAENFGGGGHEYASGFKVKDARSLNEIKVECINKATVLLNELTPNEAI